MGKDAIYSTHTGILLLVVRAGVAGGRVVHHAAPAQLRAAQPRAERGLLLLL